MSCEYSKKHPLDPLRSSLSCSIVFPIQLAHKHTHHSTFIRNRLIHKHWGLCLFQLIKHLKLTLPGFCFTTHRLRSSPKLCRSELLHRTTLCLYLLQATTAVCSSYQHTTKNSKTIEYKTLQVIPVHRPQQTSEKVPKPSLTIPICPSVSLSFFLVKTLTSSYPSVWDFNPEHFLCLLF